MRITHNAPEQIGYSAGSGQVIYVFLGKHMANGFSVDLGALGNAVEGINDTLDEVQAHDVKAVKCDDSAYGHDRLASTVSDFCDRWDLGVKNLATDDQAIADRLNTAMQAYEEADQNLTAVFKGTGSDPAANS